MAAVGEVDGAHAQTPVRYAFSKKGFIDYDVDVYDHQHPAYPQSRVTTKCHCLLNVPA